MADAIYHFVWGTFCDWYVELVKGAFDEETKSVAAWAFDQILVMLHPLMPFITEELWHAMGERPYDLIVAKWPEPEAQVDVESKREMDWVIQVIKEIRSGRTDLNIPPGHRLSLSARLAGWTIRSTGYYERNQAAINRLTRSQIASVVIFPDDAPEEGHPWAETAQRVSAQIREGSMQISLPEFQAFAPLKGLVNLADEMARLSKAAEAAEKDRDSLAQRLANPNFTERAKPEAVEKARSDHEAKAAEAERLRAALERLG
jgi:valyl-tRNA synthetase